MTAKLDIFNMALSHLGSSPVTSVDDSGHGLAAMRNNYDLLRKNLLTKAYWDFAIKRQTLALVETITDGEWSYRHALPVDFLTLKDTYNKDLYEIENNGILTDTNVLKVEYIADITDTSDFSPGFAMVLALDLAISVGYNDLMSASNREQLIRERDRLFKDARKSDAKQAAVINTKFTDTYWYLHDTSEDDLI